MAVTSRPVSVDQIDLQDRPVLDELLDQVKVEGNRLVRDELERQRLSGVIDGRGHRLRTEVPTDMREDSAADFGG